MGYSIAGGANNSINISMGFSNMEQATAEDPDALTNLMMANSTLSEQVARYANCLSTKEADNVALKIAMKTYRGR